jgi:hypothetical protein
MSTPRCFRFLVPAVLLVVAGPARATPPSDGWLVWTSNRSNGQFDVYRARADGSEVTQMTTTGGGFPSWAPDGRWIAYQDPSHTVYVMRPDGSERKVLTVGSDRVPFWLHDNSGLAIQQGGDFLVFDPDTNERTLLFQIWDFPQFADGAAGFLWNSLTHDNRYVLIGTGLYGGGYSGANGTVTATFSAAVVDLLHKDQIYWFGVGCWPFTPPAGDLIFHINGDVPSHPDIYHMHLSDLVTRASYGPEVAHEDADFGHEYNPRVSNDNRWLAYMASDGCHEGDDCNYEVWIHEIGAGPSERFRVTDSPGPDAYPSIYVGPVWQPASQPRLLVTPNRVTFFASMSAPSVAQTLKLKNSGAGTLGPAGVSPDANASWLVVSRTDGAVTLRLGDLSRLTRGTYQTNVSIAVDNALDSPIRIPVTLVTDESFPLPEAGLTEAGQDGDQDGIDGGLDASTTLTEVGSVDGGLDGGATAVDEGVQGGAVEVGMALADAALAGDRLDGSTSIVDAAPMDGGPDKSTSIADAGPWAAGPETTTAVADAGLPADGFDASTTVADARSPSTVADASPTPGSMNGGCSCVLGSASRRAGVGTLPLAALALLALRLRRRR